VLTHGLARVLAWEDSLATTDRYPHRPGVARSGLGITRARVHVIFIKHRGRLLSMHLFWLERKVGQGTMSCPLLVCMYRSSLLLPRRRSSQCCSSRVIVSSRCCSSCHGDAPLLVCSSRRGAAPQCCSSPRGAARLLAVLLVSSQCVSSSRGGARRGTARLVTVLRSSRRRCSSRSCSSPRGPTRRGAAPLLAVVAVLLVSSCVHPVAVLLVSLRCCPPLVVLLVPALCLSRYCSSLYCSSRLVVVLLSTPRFQLGPGHLASCQSLQAQLSAGCSYLHGPAADLNIA
jgi:hypothetical protein